MWCVLTHSGFSFIDVAVEARIRKSIIPDVPTGSFRTTSEAGIADFSKLHRESQHDGGVGAICRIKPLDLPLLRVAPRQRISPVLEW